MTLSPAQKTFLLTTAQAAAKGLAMSAAAHGFIAGTNIEMWTGIIVFLMSYAYSIYNDQGKVVIEAALDIVRQRILNEDAKIKAGTTTPTIAMNRLADHAADIPPLPVPASIPPAASLILLALVGLSALGWNSPAGAQAPRATIRPVPLTGDPIKDAKSAINGGQQSQSAAKTTCDFNLFAALNAQNVIKSIQDCIGAVQADISNTFLADIQTALASAQKFNDGSGDQPAVACLKPGLAIVVAGVGVPAVPAAAEVPATATSPAVPAQAAVPAAYAGPITLFQKFREFELAGGPAACKTWTLSTVSGANPLLQ